MGVAALFRCAGVPIHMLDRLFHRVPIAVEYLDPVLADHRQFIFVQPQDVPGMLQQGRDIRGNEVFPLAQPHDQRAILAYGDDLIRMVPENDAQAKEPVKRFTASRTACTGSPW